MSTKGNVYATDDGIMVSEGEGSWGLTDGVTRTKLVPECGRSIRTGVIHELVPTHMLHKPGFGYSLVGTRSTRPYACSEIT